MAPPLGPRCVLSGITDDQLQTDVVVRYQRRSRFLIDMSVTSDAVGTVKLHRPTDGTNI